MHTNKDSNLLSILRTTRHANTTGRFICIQIQVNFPQGVHCLKYRMEATLTAYASKMATRCSKELLNHRTRAMWGTSHKHSFSHLLKRVTLMQ